MNLDATAIALILSALANAIAVWRFFVHRREAREIQPTPLPVIEGDRYVTEKQLDPILEPIRDQLDRHDEELGTIREKVESNYNAIMTSQAKGRRELHLEVNAIAADVAAIKTALKPLEILPQEFNRAIGRIEGVLQREPRNEHD
jgi:hypothetical protein